MSKYIKLPALSTSFSESSKSAKKRFDNILDLSEKKKGALGFLLVVFAVMIVGVMASCGNGTIGVAQEDTTTIKGRMPAENYFAILMNINNKEVITQRSNPENQQSSFAYEPNSPFRMITLAIALEENIVSLDDEYTCNGSIAVGGHNIIPCWKQEGHGRQTIMQGMVDSCYPMVADLAEKIGKEKFYTYMKALGLADDKVDGAVFLQKQNFNEIELAISGIGQGFSATPLQIARAFSIILNGESNIISKNTSAQIADVLVRSAAITEVNNIKVGVLDGVSEKLPRGNGKYTYSTIAFAPVENPQTVCVSVIDEPENKEDSAAVALEVIRENFKTGK